MTLLDLLPPQNISVLYEAAVTNPIHFLIVFCFCCTSKLVSSGSFGWLTFSDYVYMYLSWKGKATYVDGAYSEGKGL